MVLIAQYPYKIRVLQTEITHPALDVVIFYKTNTNWIFVQDIKPVFH